MRGSEVDRGVRCARATIQKAVRRWHVRFPCRHGTGCACVSESQAVLTALALAWDDEPHRVPAVKANLTRPATLRARVGGSAHNLDNLELRGPAPDVKAANMQTCTS